jgi:prepilin-type processing-associated H-X9-DG protein
LEYTDLQKFAQTKKSPGYSYENFSWWRAPVEEKKTQQKVATRPHSWNNLGLKGIIPGPTRTYLIVDADDLFSGIPGAKNDYPDPYDNHGAAGANGAFVDGHVEWIRQRDYLIVRELAVDEDKVAP